MDLDIRNRNHDLMLESGDIATDASLHSTVILSLIANARADEDEVEPNDNRRGWWASDLGSKLWIARRLKVLPNTESRIEEYIAEALQWLINDGIAASIDIDVQRRGLDQIYAEIVVHRDSGTEERFVWNNLWDELFGGDHRLEYVPTQFQITNYLLAQNGDFITTENDDRLLWR